MRLKQTLEKAVKKALRNIPRFVEMMEIEDEHTGGVMYKEKVFNYGTFTKWCLQEFQSNAFANSPEEIAYLVRDLALEEYDPKYNHRVTSKTYHLRGMPTID